MNNSLKINIELISGAKIAITEEQRKQIEDVIFGTARKERRMPISRRRVWTIEENALLSEKLGNGVSGKMRTRVAKRVGRQLNRTAKSVLTQLYRIRAKNGNENGIAKEKENRKCIVCQETILNRGRVICGKPECKKVRQSQFSQKYYQKKNHINPQNGAVQSIQN